MTVQELIDELKKCDPNKDIVLTFCGESGRSFNYYFTDGGVEVEEREVLNLENEEEEETLTYTNIVHLYGWGECYNWE